MPWRSSVALPLSVLVAIALVSAAARAATGPSAPALVVQGLGNAVAPLDGPWQFHLGDNMAWADPGVDDSAWESIQADKPWGMQGHEGYTGYAWYRRRINFDPVAGAAPDLALAMPPVDDAYEVYWNGVLAGRHGSLPPHPVWYYHETVGTFGLGRERSGVLAVRVWKAPYLSFDSGRVGGFRAVPLAGSPQAIAAVKMRENYHWLRDSQYQLDLNLLYTLVTVLAFLAWLRNRTQNILLWVAVYGFSRLVALLLIGVHLPIPETIALGLLQPVLSLTDISLWFLLLYLLGLDGSSRLRAWVNVLAIISLTATVLDGSLNFFDWTGPHVGALQIADGVLTVIFTVVEVFPLLLVALALRKKLDAARWLVAIFAFLNSMTFVVRTALSQGERYTHWTLAEKIDTPLFVVRGNAFDFVTLTSTLLFVSIIYAVYHYAVEETRRQTAIHQEFKSAQELQRVLVPETLPPLPGYTITSAYVPAQEVGGDFFQVIDRPDGSALIVIGDVSGKGLKAAMAVALIVGALRTLAESHDCPADILAGLNRRLNGRLQHGFATCFVLRLSPEGECTMATAAHPAPYLNEFELSLPGALPLGLVPDVVFTEVTMQLNVGDRLILYTDGLLEARNKAGDLYSFDRLQQLVATNPDAQQASDAAVAFGQDDDITVLTVTRLATGAESTTSLVAPTLVPVTA